MRREVPDPWATAMIERGFVYAKRPSIRALARAAGIPSSETVRQMIHGESSPDGATSNAVADALGVPAPVVREWIGQARGSAREWAAPDEIALLTPDEQDAIRDLIRAIAKPRKLKEEFDPREYDRRIRERWSQPDAVVTPIRYADPEDYDKKIAGKSPEAAGQPEPEQP